MPSDDLQQSPVVDPEDRPVASRSRVPRRRSLLARLLPVMIVVVALGGFAGLVGYYYMADGPNGAAPLIKADLQPFKVKPDNPGGMDVPDQDKAIFDRMGRVDQSSVPPPNTERLLPPPETPVPRPTLAQNTAAAVTPPPPPAAPAATPAVAPPPPAGPAPASTPSPATSSAANPNVGSPVLGVPQTPRSPTLAAAPPGAPAGTTAPPAAAPTPAKPATTTAPAVKPAASVPTQTAAVAPRPEPASAAGGPLLRAAIASLRTEPEAKREWERQRRLYPDALSGVSPSYASVDLGGKGVYWRIYIGPPESSAEARARCAALKEKKVDCFVARP
ncbi:MAG TPA: SPOR domain-containing protein [Alphaproteobacteria bacterium]|nr:SPOR domain-containing protein [Alphaproteobacteria bacterium]